MLGRINKIIPMSVVDGEGNRTAIFLQGCNFNCWYCHNPETINNCIHCGECVTHCPSHSLTLENKKVIWNSSTCIDCDKCVEVCRHDSSPKILFATGKEVADMAAKNIPFITGITTSGGECTLQCDFLVELYREVKKLGLHILTDTNASVDLSKPQYADLVKLSDGFMVDVKSWRREDHERLIGENNYFVKKNLKYLSGIGKLTEIRTVCIDGIDNDYIIRSCGEFLAQELAQNPIAYKIIAYRHFGVRKQYHFLRTPSQEELENLKEIALSLGFSPVTVI